MEELTIGEVAAKMGLRTSAIRYYESERLLNPSRRVSGQRRYNRGVLQTIAIIQFAQSIGFTIEQVRTLLHEFPADTPPSERWQALATQKLVEVEELIRRATHMKQILESTLGCECARLEDCVTGIENGL